MLSRVVCAKAVGATSSEGLLACVVDDVEVGGGRHRQQVVATVGPRTTLTGRHRLRQDSSVLRSIVHTVSRHPTLPLHHSCIHINTKKRCTACFAPRAAPLGLVGGVA